MNFEGSAYLEWLKEPVSTEQAKVLLQPLLAIVGHDQPGALESLTSLPMRQEQLQTLEIWNQRLRPSVRRDRIGQHVVDFYVAEALTATVMRRKALVYDYSFGPQVDAILERGGDGIYEFGKSQFSSLASVASDLASWLRREGYKRPLFIESPLGNSLPVQVMESFARNAGLFPSVHVWNAPRNDRPAHGATVRDSAGELKPILGESDVVVFVDDVSTGTRFLKMFDVLKTMLADHPFLAIALIVTDSAHPEFANHQNRSRLFRRLSDQSTAIRFDRFWVELPVLRLFRIDDGDIARWAVPLVWQDSDIIAGKRKVNLVFTLLDHVFEIIEDLSSDESEFRPHLELAWSKDISGRHFAILPGIIKGAFDEIQRKLNEGGVKASIEKDARDAFPSDYRGEFKGDGGEDEFVKERWIWLGQNFIQAASNVVTKEQAWTSWRAAGAVLTSSLAERTPRPSRDHSARPFVIPFNATIRKLNQRVLSRIVSEPS